MNRLTPNDTHLGMYGVQTWSAGPLYPAVIKCVEVYPEVYGTGNNGGRWTLDETLRHRSWTVILGGEEIEGYASREDAEESAAYMVRAMRENARDAFTDYLASPSRLASLAA